MDAVLQSRLNALTERTSLPTSGAPQGRTGKVTKSDLAEDVIDYIKGFQVVRIEIPQWDVRTNVPSNDINNFQQMVDDIVVGNNIFLVGPAGTGKTFTAEVLCEALYGDPKEFLETINCSQWTSPRDIIGGETIDSYKEGTLVKAWEFGKLLLLDELTKLDPNTAGLLNDPLAKTGNNDPKKPAIIKSGDGRTVVKHPKFGVVATGNITGRRASSKYGGNNKQDASLIDRFSGSYYYVDFNRTLERNLTGDTVFDIFNTIRDILLAEEIENDITLRVMLNAHRIWRLEMERYISGSIVQGGKTLRNTVDSYLSLHDIDTQTLIKQKLGSRLEQFFNNYKSAEKVINYKKEYLEVEKGAKSVSDRKKAFNSK